MGNLIEIRKDFINHKRGSLYLFESVTTKVYDVKVEELHRFFSNSINHIAYYLFSSKGTPELVISKSVDNIELINWLIELSNISNIRFSTK